MLVRSAMHQAGASALTELLRFSAPDQRAIPCPCGQHAHYRESRSKTVLTVVGTVEVSRPYYLCPHCHAGQFPADQELDLVDTEFSPGVRRMQALVGQERRFDHGREQLKLLAGLEVTTKSIERVAESIGADIARQEQQEIDRAVQLDLPIIVGEPVADSLCPDGRYRCTRSKEGNRGPQRQARWLAGPHARGQARLRVHANHLGRRRLCHSRPRLDHLHRRHRERRAVRQAALPRGLETRLEPRREEGRHRRRRRMDLESGQGTLSRRRSNRRSVPRAPALVGLGTRCSIPTTPSAATPGLAFIRSVGSTKARSRNSSPPFARFKPRTPTWPKRSATRPTTSQPTRLA